jgi:hypothetical protein
MVLAPLNSFVNLPMKCMTEYIAHPLRSQKCVSISKRHSSASKWELARKKPEIGRYQSAETPRENRGETMIGQIANSRDTLCSSKK